MNPYNEDAAAETMRFMAAEHKTELAKNAARIAELGKELAEWKTALTTKVVQCGTCGGDGFMDVLTEVLPPNEEEVYEDVPCGECGGTGRGHVAFLLTQARAEERAACVAILSQQMESLEAVINGLEPERHTIACTFLNFMADMKKTMLARGEPK